MKIKELWCSSDPAKTARMIQDENDGDHCEYSRLTERAEVVEALKDEDHFNVSEGQVEETADMVMNHIIKGKSFYLFNCHC